MKKGKLFWEGHSLKFIPFAVVAAGCALHPLAVASQEKAAFENEPKAKALYDQMVASLRQTKSISWTSQYDCVFGGTPAGKATYKIWMKKPNFARIEAFNVDQTKPVGILVLDGSTMWTYWPNGKPQYPFERKGKYGEDFAKYSKTYYMSKSVGVGRHSLGHDIGNLGTAISMSIIDPSTFHGYTDSLQPYIDGATSMADEKVGGVDCNVIEVSFMKHQRSWYLWLSKKDHLPRKVKQIVRVSKELVMNETITDLKINPSIPNRQFVWSAPKNWKQWSLPPLEEGLLAVGTPAPDFELTSIDGKKIKLSDFKGKIVWLNFWRCG
jgi:outer membrane lipoprotein-sorting protein